MEIVAYWTIVASLALISFLLGIFRLVHLIFGSRQEEAAPKLVNPTIVSVAGLMVIAAPFILPERFSDFSLVYVTFPLGAVLLISGLISVVRRLSAGRKSR